jgi:DNA invertase Pin-like site-specific DNA recombinase
VNAFGYLRLSKWDEDTTSPQRQREAITALCKAQGWTLAETFEDIDRSGYNGQHRPGLEQMLSRLSEVRAVVAYRLDRLTRSTPDFYKLQQQFKDAGVRFLATDVQFDPESPEGRFTEGLLAGLATLESDRISVRSRAMFAYKKKAGEPVGRVPYGWKRVGKHFERDEKQQAVLRDAAERFVGGDTLSAIAADHGLLMSPLSRMLHSGRVHDALPPGLAGQLAKALLARKGERVPESRQSLLGGIATCGICGQTMKAAARKGDRYSYACHAVGHAHMQAQWLDTFVTEQVLTAVDSGELLTALKRRKPMTRTRKASEVEARMALLDEMFAAGKMTAERFKRTNAQLVEELSKATKVERENGHDLPAELARDLRATWPRLTVPERRRVIQAVLESITIAKAKSRGVRVDPARVKLTWR